MVAAGLGRRWRAGACPICSGLLPLINPRIAGKPAPTERSSPSCDRCDGEEGIPDWYFEDGVIFLPEEIESGLCLRSRSLRRHFRQAHGDLITAEYWENLQKSLMAGQVPGIRTYPEDCDLIPGRSRPLPAGAGS